MPDYERLEVGGSPASKLDYLRARRGVSRGDLIYNPGFNPWSGKCRQLLTIHDLIHLRATEVKGQLMRAYYDRLVRPTIERAGVVLTVSRTSEAAIREWLGSDTVDIVNAGNGVSDAFVPDGKRYMRDRPYILYVGNMKPHKNVRSMVEACKYLPEYDLVVVTKDGARLEELREEVGLERSRVECVAGSSDDDLASLYRGATVTAVPSLIEGFGLPALESVCSGTPVVYWRGCESVAEIVGNNGVGSVSATDPISWAEAVARARGIRVDSRAARSAYSWESVARSARATVEALA